MVKTLSTADARASFSDVLNSVFYTKEPVVVEKKGRRVAVIISPDEYEEYKAFQRERDAQAWAAIERVQATNTDKDPDELLAEVTAVVEEVRRERYERQAR